MTVCSTEVGTWEEAGERNVNNQEWEDLYVWGEGVIEDDS